MAIKSRFTRDEFNFWRYLKKETRLSKQYAKKNTCPYKSRIYEGRAQMAAEILEEYTSIIEARYDDKAKIRDSRGKHRAGHKQLSDNAGA